MEIAVKLVVRRGLHVALVLHSREPAPDPEWALAFAAYERLASDTRGDPWRARLFVISDGGTPTAVQRAQLAGLWKGVPAKTAVVVPGMENPIKRGVMTALTWVNPTMAFFMPTDVNGALAHVGLEGELDSIWPDIQELQTRVAPHRMVAIVERHSAPRSAVVKRGDAAPQSAQLSARQK